MRTPIYQDDVLALLAQHHLLRISDMHAQLDGADYSTVYRNVKQLLEQGRLRRVVCSKNTVMYERVEAGEKHDHFLCTSCGDIAAVHAAPPARSLPRGAVAEDVVIRGTCGECR